MSVRTPIVVLCVAALAACDKESSKPAAPATTVAASPGSGHNPFAKSAPEGPTATPGAAATPTPDEPPAPTDPGAPAGAGRSKPAFPGTRTDGKPAFPIPGGTTGTAAPTTASGALPGLPAGVQLPEGLPPEATAMMNNAIGDLLSNGLPELPERPGLPNWKKLAALLPAQLGEFTAEGEANGATTEVMGMATTNATRSYRGPGGRTANVILSGGDVAQLATMEFTLALPDETTPEHTYRMVQVAGKPAALEWTKESGEAEARTMVAGRFSVMITVRGAANADVAQTLLQALDLAALARIP